MSDTAFKGFLLIFIDIFCDSIMYYTNFPLAFVRYLALEGMCLLATSEFSHDTVKKHQETVINALKVCSTCGLPLTVKHILVDCPNLQDTRLKFRE